MDGREVTVHRVVNIVDKRSTMPRQGLDYNRGFHQDQWYNGPRNFQDEREFREDVNYSQKHCRYFEEQSNFGNFGRNPTPPRKDDQYSQPYFGTDDLRHQLASRKNGRPRPYFHRRGVEASHPKSAADRKLKVSVPVTFKRSPVSGEAQPPDKVSYQQAQQLTSKSNVVTSQTPTSSVEVSPHSSGGEKEKPPASVVESEEVVTASMEPKPTPDLKARRLEAIKAKALEIEKDYRKDCETFRTVVKMLVVKEPSLEDLLQAPLDKNLLELKERCLDSLKHFVMELDEVLEQPDSSSTQATGHSMLP